jgi:hypothetical protein
MASNLQASFVNQEPRDVSATSSQAILAPAPMVACPVPSRQPHDLQEEQLDYLTILLEREVSDHNFTRAKLQRYLGLYMKHERGHCNETTHVNYLNSLVYDLRSRLAEERSKLCILEDTQNDLGPNDLDTYSCVGYRSLLMTKI